ncbi:MAG: UDP-N-acetylglucosamine 1-carboxyvinyltransferase [Lachnospiraceae bacterium]|nr:UDP-N-acetylglucosamine 1-carboxyvinyltransferase [Lachnospiraceae bacterium]MCM1240957.1 UDP-N-acetylglucosamine 1-carboxyvinyltransferase [Lachnospiraceae bacterium]
MDSIHIQGGIALQGQVHIQGSKNAALPVLAATLLTGQRSYIRNCPRIADVHAMVSLLRKLGCLVTWREDGLQVDSSRAGRGDMRGEAVKGMRSSLCLLGALLGRCGEATLEHPGGCVIGERPIDLHLRALEQMGAAFSEEKDMIYAVAERLHGAQIALSMPSVGATENIILAGVTAEGDTRITGAAREPEITALCRYLQSCGAKIEGIGTDCLLIHGGNRLHGAEYTVPSDRIVAGTYLMACIGAGGCVLLEGAPGEEMEAVLKAASQMGASFWVTEEGIYVQASGHPEAVERLVTLPYPGFPTDLQSAALAVLTAAEGQSVVEERIFENRFRVAEELNRMGAHIELLDAHMAVVHGTGKLQGAEVEARELRGGAALVIAGLMAQGETRVTGCPYIYRGYENICRDFRELGARIVSV